jgi:hypothetical protein
MTMRRKRHTPHGLYGRVQVGFVELVDGRWRCVAADGEIVASLPRNGKQCAPYR